MNHGDTDETEIVSGDEGDLTPIHDIAIEPNDESENEHAVEPAEFATDSDEVVDSMELMAAVTHFLSYPFL